MGLQEPHLSDGGDFDTIRKFFAARELAFTGSITGALRGGAAIIYPIKWKLLKALSLTPRLLYVELLHPDGVPMGFFVGHLHHEAEQRKRQWELINIHAPTLFLPNTVFLCDHNSVVMPSRDIAQPHLAPERGSVLDARDAETGTLSRLRLVDSYPCTHGCRDRPLEGWTWGFHGSLPPESATASQQAERAKKKPKKLHTPPTFLILTPAAVTVAAGLTGSMFRLNMRATFWPIMPPFWLARTTKRSSSPCPPRRCPPRCVGNAALPPSCRTGSYALTSLTNYLTSGGGAMPGGLRPLVRLGKQP